jgi:effector-binding domain-containing protein
MGDFQIIDLAEQRTATRRASLPMDELKGFFDQAYEAIWSVVQAQGLSVTGPPFAAYHGMPGEVVDVEAGFPVTGDVADSDGVGASTLPACRAAVAVHVGPYEGLGDTWEALAQWAREQGLEPAGEMFWESYLSDPRTEPDPASWRTQLAQPVA